MGEGGQSGTRNFFLKSVTYRPTLGIFRGGPVKTLPKAQRTRGLSSAYQSNFLGHISSSYTNLDQILSSELRPSKSEQKFNFMTKLQLPNLHKSVVNMFFSINISNSNSINKFELASSHARITSIKSTKQDGVSWFVTEKGRQ